MKRYILEALPFPVVWLRIGPKPTHLYPVSTSLMYPVSTPLSRQASFDYIRSLTTGTEPVPDIRGFE